ncbi:hypothetical protein C6P44_001071 [Monosporozyma unispora]|nr:hypothetical protein C6P44_001071 [Kazachstania unispora]
MKHIQTEQTIAIPEGVTVAIKSRVVKVTGPRGTLTKSIKHIDVTFRKVSPTLIKVTVHNDLNFKLNPINNHNFVQQINDINYNSTCCIRYKLNITELQDLQLVKLNIENIIPKYTNIDRFGGSSDSQGKQFIQLTIKSWPSGNLIRYKRYLPNGENNIVFNIMSLKDTEIETCLTNLSYDASWNLMDLDKMIQYEITTLSKEKIKINEFCQKTVTNKHFLNVHDVLQDVREINSHWKDPSWNKLQKSYLFDSLSSAQALRPDGRLPYQFRPIEIYTDFLPSSNGSSRIIASDGSECIISVKSKVVDHTVEKDLVQVDIDIAGERDDSILVESITSLFNKIIDTIDVSKLQLTQKYSFKIYIDVLVLSTYSYPVSLISFGIYSALNSTYLPKLISSFDDLEVEELPTFHDYDLVKLDVSPPLIFVLAIVGDNIFIDPAFNESKVANNGLIISWSQGKVIAPVRTMALNNTYVKGFKPSLVQEGIDLVNKYGQDIVNALV